MRKNKTNEPLSQIRYILKIEFMHCMHVHCDYRFDIQYMCAHIERIGWINRRKKL